MNLKSSDMTGERNFVMQRYVGHGNFSFNFYHPQLAARLTSNFGGHIRKSSCEMFMSCAHRLTLQEITGRIAFKFHKKEQ